MSRSGHSIGVLLILIIAAGWCQVAANDFDDQIAPLLVRRCLECHNERQAAGGLILTNQAGALAGGDSGEAIEPGSADSSYLIDRVRAGEMPPPVKGQPQPLPEAEIAQLTAWIDAGADWPANRVLDLMERTTDVRGGRDWWSLQPVERPAVPQVDDSAWPRGAIDAFVLARLKATGLDPAPRASPRTLVRRLYHDLVGLPATRGQIEEFEADPSDENWERMVDRLLASPHFGERWARYWLDVVRFAETCGYERDQEKPYAWRYRDWVVNAINNDMPYDRFVIEQLAGDQLADRSKATVIATGFLRLGTWNDEPNNPEDYVFERLEDLVHSTSSAFLGLTVKCARCHDHKFDPIVQEDYYRMAAVFWPGPIQPRGANLLGGPTTDELGFDDVLGWTDVRSDAAPLHVLKGGNRHQPGQPVAPAPLSAVSATAGNDTADSWSENSRLALAHWIADAAHPLTARVLVNRLWQHHFGAGIVRSANNFGFRGQEPTHPALLDWLAAELTSGGWRTKRLHKMMVMSATYRQAAGHPQYDQHAQVDAANRFCWHANRRRMDAETLRDAMLAATGQIDLAVGGPSFRPTIAAEATEGLSKKDAAWVPSPEADQRRRSLYIFSQRSLLVPFLTTFDFADTTLPCARRDVTTVAPQALALLNNAQVHGHSQAMAQRVVRETGSDDLAGQIRRAWEIALARQPADGELHLAVAHVESQRDRFASQSSGDAATAERLALESLCHVLLNSNEFVYVD